MPLTLILRHINHNANVHTRLLVHDDMNNIYKDLEIIQFKKGVTFSMHLLSFPPECRLSFKISTNKTFNYLSIHFYCKKHKNLIPI